MAEAPKEYQDPGYAKAIAAFAVPSVVSTTTRRTKDGNAPRFSGFEHRMTFATEWHFKNAGVQEVEKRFEAAIGNMVSSLFPHPMPLLIFVCFVLFCFDSHKRHFGLGKLPLSFTEPIGFKDISPHLNTAMSRLYYSFG